MATTVKELVASSLEVIKVVPAYDHLMTGTKLNLPLASKHLVGWPSKKALGSGCIALETAMKGASKSHSL